MVHINGRLVDLTQRYPDSTSVLSVPAGSVVDPMEALHNTTAINVLWQYKNDEEVLPAYMLFKHLRALFPKAHMVLRLPYVPNARKDRVNDERDVFTLKWFAHLINDCSFDAVYVLDVHSPVTVALIDRCYNWSMLPVFKDVAGRVQESWSTRPADTPRPVYFVFPDSTAEKRYAGLIDEALTSVSTNDATRFVRKSAIINKTRSTEDGKITHHGKLDNGHLGLPETCPTEVFVVDDICAYGGTLRHACSEIERINPNATVCAIITHCEASAADAGRGIFGPNNCPKNLKELVTTNSIDRGTDFTAHVSKHTEANCAFLLG